MLDIDEKEKAAMVDLITAASVDLDEMFCKIKKSKKLLKYKSKGSVMMEMYAYIMSGFCLLNILEMSAKAKMIHNESKNELSRIQRFDVFTDIFKSKFDHVYQQHLDKLKAGK